MTSPLSVHTAPELLSAFCTCIEKDIHPVSAAAVAAGSKLFGAAILKKSDLSVVLAETNREARAPIWHGETYAIKQFFELPKENRPAPKDCLFLTTHEPCSLCLSAITWSGFDNFTYLYTYEQTRDWFECAGDLDILAHVFNVRPGETATPASIDGKQKAIRPEYKLHNKYFVALSFEEIVATVNDPAAKEKWAKKVEEIKKSYGSISEAYRRNIGT